MAILTDVGVVDTGDALCSAAVNGREGSANFLLQQQQQRKKWATHCKGSYAHAAIGYHGRTPMSCSIDACSPRVARRLLDAGVDTTMGVHISYKVGSVTYNETPLTYTTRSIGKLTADGKDSNEEKLQKLEAIRRLLLQVGAVHAVSWLWLGDVSSIDANGAERTRQAKMPPTAGTVLRLMLPILRRRARRPGVLLAALWRWGTVA